MTYVPTPVHVPAPPSPRTRELADRLDKAIQEYRQERQTVTDQEVRAALQLVQQRSVSGSVGTRLALMAGVGVLTMGAGVFAFFLRQQGGLADGQPFGILAVAAVIALMGLVVALIRVMRSGGP